MKKKNKQTNPENRNQENTPALSSARLMTEGRLSPHVICACVEVSYFLSELRNLIFP